MNIQEINALTKASVGQLTSEQYLTAHNDPATGKQFAEKINQLENAPKTPATETAARPHGNVRGPDATPASTSFDPSFDDAPAPAAAAPAPAAPAAPAPGTLAIWRYQPTDSQGRKVGGEQVFKYDPTLPVDDPQSLASQLTKAHSFATRALKEKKTQAFIESVTPAEDTGYQEPARLSMFDHPEAEKLNAMTDAAMNNGVLSALNLFKQRHPEFVLGKANAVAMLKWVEKSKRNPADGATWEAAWTALKPYLLPDEAEVAPAPAPVVEQPKAAPAVRSASASRVGTGLSNADVFNEEPVVVPTTVQGVKLVIDGKTQVIDLRGWDRLTSDAQKRLLRNASNASAIDALYRADEERKAARKR